MQAFCCDVLRAFTNEGIAIAASRPMIATTIMISTNVKAEFLFIFTSLRHPSLVHVPHSCHDQDALLNRACAQTGNCELSHKKDNPDVTAGLSLASNSANCNRSLSTDA